MLAGKWNCDTVICGYTNSFSNVSPTERGTERKKMALDLTVHLN